MIKIAPSILSADFARLAEEIYRIKQTADWLHVDVMDGRFVPNLTIGPPVVEALKKETNLFLDVHLMIVEPEKHLENFARAGADLITVHAEACHHLHRVLSRIRELGAKAGVAFNPATPVHLLNYVFNQVDLVLVMSVNPGFGGQEFIPGVLTKIKEVAQWAEKSESKVEVQVDGGINASTAPRVIDAGATVLVAGSAVFGKEKPDQAIQALKMYPASFKKV